MVGAKAVVGFPAGPSGTGGPSVVGYELVDKSTSAIIPTAFTEGYSNASVAQSNGGTVLNFCIPAVSRRRLSSASSFAISAEVETNIIWAIGGGNTFSAHAQRGSAKVDFNSGSVFSVATPAIKIAHGIIMVLAWGVILPLGIIGGRYFRSVASRVPGIAGATRPQTDRQAPDEKPSSVRIENPIAPKHSRKDASASANPASKYHENPSHAKNGPPSASATTRPSAGVATTVKKAPLWFRWHKTFQWSGAVLLVTGFVISVVMTDQSHFSSTHAILGLVTTIAGLLQPLNALFRPPPQPLTHRRRIWEIAHRGLGWTAAILANVVIILGLQLIDAHIALTITYAVYLLGLFGSVVVLELRLQVRKRKLTRMLRSTK